MKRILFACAVLAALPIICRAQEITQEKEPPAAEETNIIETKSGLKYTVLVQGEESPLPTLTDKVNVHYQAWLEDGTLFDASDRTKDPAQFAVSRIFPGLSEALQMLTPGSKYKFFIPPQLAFGDRGSPPRIPPNAMLTFEIELINIEKGPPLPEYHEPTPDSELVTESGLAYEILTPGKEESPNAGDLVRVKYAFWNHEKKLVDCSELNGNDLRFAVGEAKLPFLNEGIQLVKKGSRVRFIVQPILGFGEKGAGPLVPPHKNTIWELELIDIMQPLPVPEFSASPEDKVITTESGLKYEILKEGTGKLPTMDDDVTAHYAGWLEDGTCFDNSFQRGEPTVFKLGQLVQGWNEGLLLMKEGSVFKFTIPSELGYGPRGSPPKIPPNATLIFHVELVKVGK